MMLMGGEEGEGKKERRGRMERKRGIKGGRERERELSQVILINLKI